MEAALKADLTPLKVNVVLMKGFNDDEIGDFAALARDWDIEVRFIELMPVGAAESWEGASYLPNQAVLEALPELGRAGETAPGRPAEIFTLPGGRGRIGLINPISHKFCAECNRLRISADGRLLPCLHSRKGMDIRQRWREGFTTTEIFREALQMKPLEHRIGLGESNESVEEMHRVGG